jgi:signal peptidase I
MEKRRSVVWAVLLSIFMPGLGQVYCGRLVRALIFWPLAFLGWAIFLIGWGSGGLTLAVVYPAFVVASLLVWIAAAVDAGRLALRTRTGYRLRAYNIWYLYLLLWIVCMSLPNWGLVRYVRHNLLATYVLASDNMRPTLLPGDGVMVDRRGKALADLKRGALVAIRDPKGEGTVRFLRLTGLEGETIELSADGLKINGRQIDRRPSGEESYEHKSPAGEWIERHTLKVVQTLGDLEFTALVDPEPQNRHTGSWKLGANQILLLGDNRLEDGALKASIFKRADLIGRVFLVRWSKDPRTRRLRKERRRLAVE